MKKTSQELETEINSLVTELMGDPGTGGAVEKSEQIQKYQLPVRHTKGGVEINKENKPWVIGTYSSTPFLREIDKTIRPHHGVDLAAPKGSPIYPIGPGKVAKTQTISKGRGGITIYLSHEDGKVISYYAHLDKINVVVGQEVDFNTVIGTVGDTGNARGTQPHVHYEVRVDNKRVNPQGVTGQVIGSLSKKAEFIRNLINKLDSNLNPNPSKERLRKLKGIMKDVQHKNYIGEARTKNS